MRGAIMVTDFRNVGRVPQPTEIVDTATAGKQGCQVIALSLYVAGAGFFLGGLWLIFGTQALFPPDLSRLMGLAFMISAVADVIAVKVLQRVWAKRGRSS
jgi:hypothetical protein